MSDKTDMPEGWNYVRRGIIWHIAQDTALYQPGPLSLCGKTEAWHGNTRGAWAVAKLCGACRRRWTNRAASPASSQT